MCGRRFLTMDYLTVLTILIPLVVEISAYVKFPDPKDRFVNHVPPSEVYQNVNGIYKKEYSTEIRDKGLSFCFTTHEFDTNSGCMGRMVSISMLEDQTKPQEQLEEGASCKTPYAAQVKIACDVDAVINTDNPLIEREGKVLKFHLEGNMCLKSEFTYNPEKKTATELPGEPFNCLSNNEDTASSSGGTQKSASSGQQANNVAPQQANTGESQQPSTSPEQPTTQSTQESPNPQVNEGAAQQSDGSQNQAANEGTHEEANHEPTQEAQQEATG